MRQDGYRQGRGSFCRLTVLAVIVGLQGCSFINFSANYYTPPTHYRQEVALAWQKLHSQLPLKKEYRLRLVNGRDSDRLNGVPAVSENTVLLPDDFVKYVYQNYYSDRLKIFGSILVHEITHPEYDLPSRPPKQHFRADVAAITLLGNSRGVAQDYYNSLRVMKDYWFARKGVGGHALNAAWNTLNAGLLLVTGRGYFADFYATDLEQRMGLIAQRYQLSHTRGFNRSRAIGR